MPRRLFRRSIRFFDVLKLAGIRYYKPIVGPHTNLFIAKSTTAVLYWKIQNYRKNFFGTDLLTYYNPKMIEYTTSVLIWII